MCEGLARAISPGMIFGDWDPKGHWPEGLEKVLVHMKKKYQNPKIYITENGLSTSRNDELPFADKLKDPERIAYIVRHLYRINKAIKKGVSVKGYFCWAMFDDFEWGKGFLDRFGLYHIDFTHNYRRTPKHSAKWFKAFLQSNVTRARAIEIQALRGGAVEEGADLPLSTCG
ncbi:hypothetical protein ACLB2K_049126 [Fragaria x ananassa]